MEIKIKSICYEGDILCFSKKISHIRMIRVFKRWINQRSGRESYNSKPTWNFLWCNIKRVLDFNQMKRGLLQELSIFGEKVKIYKHSKEAYEFVMKSFPQV